MNRLSESICQCPAQVHFSSVGVGPQNLDDSLEGSLCDTQLFKRPQFILPTVEYPCLQWEALDLTTFQQNSLYVILSAVS